MRKIILFLVLSIFAIGILYMYFHFQLIQESWETNTNKVDEKYVSDILDDNSLISSKMIDEGFWYWQEGENGESFLAFFDMNDLGKADMSKEEVNNLLKKINNSHIAKKDEIRRKKNIELPQDLRFHNEIQNGIDEGLYLKKLNLLKNKKQKTADDWFQLSYLYNLSGDYLDSQNAKSYACKLEQKYCKNKKYTFYGHIIDYAGVPVSNAKVTLLSKTKEAITDQNGDFIFNNIAFGSNLEKIRINISRKDFVDLIDEKLILNHKTNKINLGTFVITKGISDIFALDLDKKEISCKKNDKVSCWFVDNKFVLQTEKVTYKIPIKSFYIGNQLKEHGKVFFVAYFFNNGTVPSELINLDIFDSSGDLSGTSMYSHGMPYIQIFDSRGERIDVLSSHPMDIEMTILNFDDIKQKIKKSDLELLLKQSKSGWIDFDFLRKHFIIEFPAFWVLDRKTGVWNNIGLKLLDKYGLMRSVFYTTK